LTYIKSLILTLHIYKESAKKMKEDVSSRIEEVKEDASGKKKK